ncbi:MAG: DUF1501 domain-containing protein [Planctomycetota bacterium]|nr:MAG: DUF1501 domain-containing protein [Planctomycetota bacterium]
MLHIPGSPKQLCGGVTRRELLQIGGIGALGMGLDGALQAEQPGSQAKAKSCIFVFLFGSPPQHETFDPKPDAAAEIQGEMGPISTSLPGVQFCEGLPRIAQVADRLTVVRSMTHPYPIHCCAYVMTGMPVYSIPLETAPRAPEHWPFMGSIVDYLDAERMGNRMESLPRNIGLPWRFCSHGSSPQQAGPYGAFLGNGYDPFWTDFAGEGTTVVPKLNADSQTEEVLDPHAGITPDARLQLAAGCRLPEEIPPNRFDARRHLLAQFDAARPAMDAAGDSGAYTSQQERAFSLIGSRQIREALDVGRESEAMRAQYGMTLFGQSCLAARRLVEAGARFVSVFWDPYGPHGASVWDTHSNHYPRLRNYLLPVFDQSFSTLIADLGDRGLLDETLVLCTSEHGRTPQLDSKPTGGARHHWSRAYSSVFAGGGMARGQVVGETDALGGDVVQTPISPKDMQATAYHLLGYPESTTVPDQQGRPHPIAGSGRVRHELFG